jgi:hypothetical protein
METRRTLHRRMWLIVAFAGLSITAAICLGRIEPTGRKAALIQFDAISEMNMDEGFTNAVVFARYWVCRDYYAVCVSWCERHGVAISDMKTLAVLSDTAGVRIDDQRFPDWVPLNSTYPKPIGERDPFRWGGGSYEHAEMRFAEAQAVSRRVYISDIAGLKEADRGAGQTVDVNVPKAVNGVTRKLAQLKVRTEGDKIESMELFDAQQQSLCRTRYEYEQAGNSSAVAKLIAELPVRPQKLAVDVNMTIIPKSNPAGKRTYKVTDVDHVYHKGGRTCTVAYRDVAVGDQVLRLPVRVEVRNSEDKRLLRSARLMNFKRVDLDKAGVWEAAKAFGGLSTEDQAWQRLVGKYLEPTPKLGRLRVDPNDLDFVRRLVAKYPLPEEVRSPRKASSETRTQSSASDREPQPAWKAGDARRRELEEWTKRRSNTPEPQRMDIEPNDLRVIRQLERHYRRVLLPMTEEQKTQLRTKRGMVSRRIPKSQAEISDLRHKLTDIQRYHRAPTLPEDLPPQMDPNDLELIRRLQAHYEALAVREDRGLGGRLKAIDCLTRLDRVLKDYDAFEGHAVRYLQMLDDAGLSAMYMVGGCGNIEKLVEAGQYGKANKLMRQWADKSAAGNDPDVVYRFAGWDFDGEANPWAAVQVLDRFLRKPGLSPVQRYEGLALRAIALDKIDKLLADPKTAERESRNAQAKWVLSTTSRQELAKRVEPALREALSAWQLLGPARASEAKPYSTNRMSPSVQNLLDYPDATRLQETSALLDQIVRQRGTGQSRPSR